MAKAKVAKLSVAVDQDLIDLAKFVADRQGKQFSEWVRGAVQAAIPRNAKAVMEGAEEAFLSAEVAHAIADKPQELVNISVPLQNELKRTDGNTAVPETFRPGIPTHPCGWLKAEWYAPFDRRTSNGTCYNPSQRGKACFFNAVVAAQCPAFGRKT